MKHLAGILLIAILVGCGGGGEANTPIQRDDSPFTVAEATPGPLDSRPVTLPVVHEQIDLPPSSTEASTLPAHDVSVSTSAAPVLDWPQWRGPRADGVADNPDLPIHWSRTENVAWSVELPGWGTSSPVVYGDRVFVTSQVEQDGKKSLLTLCYRKSDGQELWRHDFGFGYDQPTHQKSNLACCTPTVTEDGVFVCFGNAEVARYSHDGELKWITRLVPLLGKPHTSWGFGSSPVILPDAVLVPFEHHAEPCYLVGLDKQTGEIAWKISRGIGTNYTTPLLIEQDGRSLILTTGKHRLTAFDAETHEQLWQYGEGEGPFNGEIVVSPVFGAGVIFTQLWRQSPIHALRLNADGSYTPLWVSDKPGPQEPSLLYYQGLLYALMDNGVIVCSDALTGSEVYRKRIGGSCNSSPIAVNGHIYFSNNDGQTFVVRAGRQYELVATNDLGERITASSAIAGRQLFYRTDSHLFCIGNAEATTPLAQSPATTEQMALAGEVVVDGTVKSVDAQGRVLTIETKRKTLELDVSRKATITIGGKERLLEDLKPGQAVTISYESSLEVVTKIEAADAAPDEQQRFIVLDISAKGDCTVSVEPRPADEEMPGEEIEVSSLPGARVTKQKDGTLQIHHDFDEGELPAFSDHGHVSVKNGVLALEPKEGEPYSGKWAYAEYSKRLRLPMRLAIGVKEFGRNTLVIQLRNSATNEQLVLNLVLKDGQDSFTLSSSWRQGAGEQAKTTTLLENATLGTEDNGKHEFRLPVPNAPQPNLLFWFRLGVRGDSPMTLESLTVAAHIVPTFGIGFGERGNTVFVERVLPNSLAERAGLKPGDVMTGISGKLPRSMRQAVSMMGDVEFGETVTLAIQRSGRRQTIRIKAE